MRMTNEEFQAEVFRRSRVYMQEKQRSRRRLISRAAAFAGCFVLVACGVVLHNTAKHSLMESANQSITGIFGNYTNSAADYAADSYEASSYAEEASEENDENAYCAEAPSAAKNEKAEEQVLGGDTDMKHAKGAKQNGGKTSAAATASNQKRDEMDEAPEADAELSADAYFEALGINPMPEMLGGFQLHGDPTLSRVPDEKQAFSYIDETGSEALTVYLEPENASGRTEKDILIFHTDEGASASFVLQKASVKLVSRNMTLQDVEQLGALAKELLEALETQ